MSNEMDLPDGKTCKDCVYCYRCTKMFGVKESNTECDFYPVEFLGKNVLDEDKKDVE